MKNYLLPVLGIAMVFASCKKDLEPQESSVPMAAATPTPAAASPVPATQPLAQPVANVQPATPAPVKTAPGMNPPHGQPGHRCDIAVGAPLNSPPGKAPAASQPIKIGANGQVVGGNNGSYKITQNPAPAVKTAPGMNPPHGQAGHRCDIAVGAPLNSPPGKTAAASTPVTINADGQVNGGDGKVKITRTSGTPAATDAIPTLLQAPPAEPAKSN